MEAAMKVLLVDDEPLALAGIKILVDWEALGCEVVGTARNGQAALEAMGQQHPDIVIADINMPVMNGVELIRAAEEEHPLAVFLMLTNLQEFDLARQTMRHKAVDYLVKTQLEPEQLSAAVLAAKEEVLRRRRQYRTELQEGLAESSLDQVLRESARSVLTGAPSPKALEALEHAGIMACCRFLNVLMQYPLFTKEDCSQNIEKLYLWEYEVVSELARNSFSHCVAVEKDPAGQEILLLLWGDESDKLFREKVANFSRKLAVASANITGVAPCVLCSGTLRSEADLAGCRGRFRALQNQFYLCEAGPLFYDSLPGTEYRELGLDGIAGRLAAEVKARNKAACDHLFERIMAQLDAVPHMRAEGVWLCTDVYSALCEALQTLPMRQAPTGLFADEKNGHRIIGHLVVRSQLKAFFAALRGELSELFAASSPYGSETVELAKKHIYSHIGERIRLQDVARAVSISPGYLSAVFKKQCNENFIDFVNRAKMERACEMIEKGDRLISQVGYDLGFENAYYFTRVFKRHLGMTPTEYQEKIREQQKQ